MKQIIQTDKAPAAIGPYSQGVRVGPWLFCAGQIPLNPKTGQMVQGDIQAQARQALRNLQAVIEAAGMTLQDVVKVTVYLTEIDTFPDVNQVYAEFFKEPYPARVVVQVEDLPKGARIEIEAVAYSEATV